MIARVSTWSFCAALMVSPPAFGVGAFRGTSANNVTSRPFTVLRTGGPVTNVTSREFTVLRRTSGPVSNVLGRAFTLLNTAPPIINVVSRAFATEKRPLSPIANVVSREFTAHRLTSCYPCRLYADLVPVFCIVDVGDVLVVLNGYSEAPGAECLTEPEAGALVFAGGCPEACALNADCVSPVGTPQCVNGQCCDLTDVSEVLAVLDSYSGNSACPPPCPSGACEIPDDPDTLKTNEACCRDATYFAGPQNTGTTETDCSFAGGAYLGAGTSCAMSALPWCP